MEFVVGLLLSLASLGTKPMTPLDYIDASGSVTLSSGESMHVTCKGTGGPTAVLLAGSGGWSIKWASMHKGMAAKTRVCAIDRPGSGMSGVGRGVTAMDMVEDYREALALAGEQGPFIIVGHSSGGLEAVHWAGRYSDEVAGLLLVDPAMDGLAKQMKELAPGLLSEMKQGMGQIAQYYRVCADTVEAAERGEDANGIERCVPRADDPAVLEALRPATMDADRFRYTASEIENFMDPEADFAAIPADLGGLPIILLQATIRKAPPMLSDEAKAQSALIDARLEEYHESLIETSSRAELRPVAEASHDILADKPEAIVAALRELIDGLSTAK